MNFFKNLHIIFSLVMFLFLGNSIQGCPTTPVVGTTNLASTVPTATALATSNLHIGIGASPSNWSVLLGTTNLCPNTIYTILIPQSMPILNFTNTNTGTMDFDILTGGTQSFNCSVATVAATSTTISFTITTLTGSPVINARNLGAGSCGTPSGGCSQNYNITILSSALITFPTASVCEGSSLAIDVSGSCSGTGCGSATYAWTGDMTGTPSALVGTTSSIIIPNGTYTGYTSPSFTLQVQTTVGSCVNTSNIVVTRNPIPNITLNFASKNANNGEICIHGTEPITATCTNYGTSPTFTSNWYYDLQGGGVTYVSFGGLGTGGTSVSNGTNTTYTYTVDPETTAPVPGTPGITVLPPGQHTISVTADIGGCVGSTTGTLIVNDRPAVKLGWVSQDYSGYDGYYPNGVTDPRNYAGGLSICAGTAITLEAVPCSNNFGSIGTHQAIPNYNTTTTSPNDPNLAGRTYDCPCLSAPATQNCVAGTGNFYANMVWSVTSGAGATSPIATNTSLSQNTNCTVAAGTLVPGGNENLSYRLDITDANGCTNYDTVLIRTRVADTEFRYSGTTYAAGGTIPVCTTTPALSIKGSGVNTTNDDVLPFNADDETVVPYSGTTFVWSRQSGPLGPPNQAINTGTAGRFFTTNAPGVPSLGNTVYRLTITDGWGCIGIDDITVSVGDAGLTIPATTVVCNGNSLVITNTSHVVGTTYAVSKSGLPVVSSSAAGVITVPLPTSGVYTVQATNTAGCTSTANITVTVSPPITFTTTDPAPLNTWCNNEVLVLEAEATGGIGVLNYTWIPTGIGLSGGPASAMGTASSSGSSGYYQWVFSGFFVTLIWVPTSSTQNNYTYELSLPPQTNATNTVSVTDAVGCTATHTWTFDILECGVPIFNKSKTIGTTPGYSLVRYVCLDDVIELQCEVQSSGALGYTPTYQWSTGQMETNITSTINRPVNLSSPDTIFTWCLVRNTNDTSSTNTSNIVGIVFDTTIVSRGFINSYPLGDNNPAVVDTIICLNEVVDAKANCPQCRGEITYLWDGWTVHHPQVYGSTVDEYYGFTGTVSNTTFNVPLTVRHGEGPTNSYCLDSTLRTVYVNPLPSVSLLHNSAPVLAPIYLCNGDVEVLSIDMTTCPTCNQYIWNTSANSLSINVSSQGGYYAQVVDGNSCKGVTNYAIVIAADDGLNSSIAANPTQVCSGDDVVLEVAPCAGCTYEWFNTLTGSLTPLGRTYTTNVLGSYYAEVTNAQGCIYPTTPVAVTSAVMAIPNIAGTTDSLCPGSVTTLSTITIGNLYQWYLNGTIISGATNSTYTTNVPGAYTVAVTYSNGCISESPIFRVYSVTYQPNIIATTNVVCSGATADLSTDLHTGWTYQWYNNGVIIPGAIGSVYNAVSAGSHYVEVTTDYLCIVRSDSVNITTSTLPVPNATTPTSTICPGEYGELSVSLCSSCSYQWFDSNGNPITTDSAINYRYSYVTATGNYYAVVSGGGCSENSDTVSITINAVFTPAINTSSDVVCDGRNALLITPRCISCSYSWLLDTVPVLGALNDTFHLVDDPIEVGNYQIAVSYPNGCSDTSAALLISDGSYNVNLTVQGPPIDSVICNGVGETLVATPDTVVTGTYFYTLFLNNTPVTGFSNVTSGTFANRNTSGVYTVQVTDPRGCRELSNILPLRSVNVAPVLTARATSDANSVPASAICTSDGTVFMEVSNCAGCIFDWRKGGSSIVPAVPNTQTTYTTLQGVSGTGIYIVLGENDGCIAASNPITIANLAGTLDASPNATDTSICNGQSVTLKHNASNNNPTLFCNGCSFRWLRGSVPGNSGNPINGASNYQYIAGTPGYYYLELTTAQGCVDTSSAVHVRQVDPPAGMMLAFDTAHVTAGVGTPLASNGSVIDLNYWVFPSNIRHDSLTLPDSSYFTSAPFSGALSPNAGLIGVVRDTFRPADSLAGYHLVTYHYITQGCEFTVDDVLEVLPPAAITVTNTNPSSVPYEACVGDSLVIQTVNLRYPIDSVFAFDVNDIYVPMPISILRIDTNVFGVDTFYSTRIGFEVQGYAYASYLLLKDSSGNRDTTTSFVLIHNTDLSFTGLPNMLCSNGTGITLFGNPSGGIFTVRDTTPVHNIYAGLVTGNVLTPSLLNPALYQNGRHAVDVFYSYTETYTNGNLCPNFDTVSQRMEVKDVRLTSVQFNKVSVSQDKELLTDLVYRVQPYRARANKPNYEISFSGSFTFPAGNPTYFLPENAGVGLHPLTYRIKSGDCINSMTSNIQVVPAPAPINLPDTICRNHASVTFGRSPAYSYLIPSPLFVTAATVYKDTFHIMKVRTAHNNLGLTVLNPNPGVEQFRYDPAAVVGYNTDTLIVEYWFRRDEETLGVDFDTLDYVVGRIYQPVYIEDLDTVNIIDTIVNPFYCEENVLHLLAGNPTNNVFGDGLFMLYGGTGQYATGDTLPNSVINPFQVNGSEGTVTTYDLVYILNGAVCKNSDTMAITISKGLYPSFATANGMDEFCDSDPAVAIIHNVSPPDTAIWKIGGVPQSSYTFAPQPLDPGIHVVELQMVDTFGCSATAKDTFTIHALPTLTMTPGLNAQYCANDPVVNFVVGPSPCCPSYLAPGQYILDQKFTAGIPPTWTILNSAGSKFWTPTTVLPQGGTGGAAFVDTSNTVQANTWLITDSLNVIPGHTYLISYMVRAGDLNPACSGFCDAFLDVRFGTSPTPASMGVTLASHSDINNDDTYVPHTIIYQHTGLAGKRFLGFFSYTQPLGRSLRLDNIKVRDLTIGNCNLGGIGYVNGEGVHNIQDSLYQFNPLAVDPGSIDVKYIYTDINGCQDSLVYPVVVDSFPIVSFTNLDSSYCANEPTVMITGSPLGGAFTSTLTGNLTNVPFTAPLDTAWYPVHYMTNVPGTDIVSYSYTDGNGCTSIHRDTVVVVPMLDSAIVDNAIDPFGIGHCLNASPSVLNYIAYSGAPLPGVFYGPGVRNGAGGPGVAMFHPDSAAIDMGHTGNATITYIYLTTTNCVDTTRYTTEVHAMPDLSLTNLPDSLCLNAERFQVIATNSVVTGALGNIMYTDTIVGQVIYDERDENGIVVSNFIYLFDSLTPALAAGHGMMYITATHTTDTSLGSCTATIYDSIRIDTIPVVYFQGMKDFYCENEPQSIILAFPPYKVGSGYMLIDTLPIDTSLANINARIDSSFYWVNPLAMISPSGTTTVYPSYYTYTDTRGCRGEVYDTFEIRPFPRIVFSPTFQTEFCRQPGTYNLMQEIISPLGGYFTDNLALTSILNDSLLDLNSLAGPRLVTYHYVDANTTCSNSDSIWINLYNSPYLDFNVFGGCSAADITFDGYATNLIQGIDAITSITWDFNTPSTITTSPLDTTPITIPDITHQYPAAGIYNATLYVENQGLCVASITKPVIISPSVTPTPYFEDFESGAGNWYNEQSITTTPSNIWSHTNSLGGNYINDPGNGAWVTMGDSLYQPGQSAWVYSPCFDFTNSLRPMIAFDLWRDMLVDIDGVVMEFYNYPTNTWERVGDVGEGIKWYQSDFILGRPGNQANVTYPRGWTGRSNGFESARLRLDPFRGQTNVRFRLAFASSPQTVITDYEGAAFDNVWVGERTRNVLVEHFDHIAYINSAAQNADVIDKHVYDQIFNTAYGLDVSLIQYQTDIISTVDPVNSRTQQDVSARTYLYGINDNNRYMLDGRKIGNGVSYDLDEYSMDYDMLQFPDFDIDINNLVVSGTTLNVNSTVTALKNLPLADYAVHTVVIQDSMTINANGFNMLSIMRKMLPNPAGTPFNQAWTMGSSVTVPQSWDFSGEIGQASFNNTQLEVVVFVQNMNTKEIFQVESTQDYTAYIGVDQLDNDPAAEITDLKVYPNPSSDFFTVEFDKELKGAYNWRLVDVTGRILQTGIAEQGTKNFTIDAEKLTNGAYFFVINSDTVYTQRKLVVIK